jgi:hypothetical protein|nr:MAG TPA: hypothetical protein [Caudoviricetes sp.]
MAKAENTVIFDGIQYDAGDELPDLGSWVCTGTRSCQQLLDSEFHRTNINR